MAFLFNFLRKTEYTEEYKQVISFKNFSDFLVTITKDVFSKKSDDLVRIKK